MSSLLAALVWGALDRGPLDSGQEQASAMASSGFPWWRFSTALSPYTPAVLVEMGFMGNEADRVRMRDHPELYEAGHRLMPVDTAGDGWYEVFSRGLWRGVWIHDSELD
ncbi:MAG: hypothetical protein ABIJ86_12950 [Spirochaetota bacterium]